MHTTVPVQVVPVLYHEGRGIFYEYVFQDFPNKLKKMKPKITNEYTEKVELSNMKMFI